MFSASDEKTGFCDIHCHLLPGIDDGPATEAVTLEMCRQAAADGIGTVVATPHFNDRFQPTRQMVAAAIQTLNDDLASRGVLLNIIAGADVSAVAGLGRIIMDRPWLTIGGQGKYLLLEPPVQMMPIWLNDLIFDLRTSGINVILTHPERNAEVLDNPNAVLPMVQSGVLVQITADSLLGTFGPDIHRCAVSLLKMNAVHFIATDAHSADYRCPRLAEAAEKARKYLGDDAIRLVRENPFAAVRGETIHVPDPEPLRSWFSRMLAGS